MYINWWFHHLEPALIRHKKPIWNLYPWRSIQKVNLWLLGSNPVLPFSSGWTAFNSSLCPMVFRRALTWSRKTSPMFIHFAVLGRGILFTNFLGHLSSSTKIPRIMVFVRLNGSQLGFFVPKQTAVRRYFFKYDLTRKNGSIVWNWPMESLWGYNEYWNL